MNRPVIIAIAAGLIPLFVIVWAFFETLLPFATPWIDHPFRALVPFLVLLFTAFTLGYVFEPGVRLGMVASLPGAIIGGILGILAAIELAHLFTVLGMVLAYVITGVFGSWLAGLRKDDSVP